MCGIVGAVAQRDIAEILLEGLRRLEYRGYDSAGLAVVDSEGHMTRVRRPGKVQMLAQAVEEQPLHGGTGIAHTRWATHGEPSESNAHPHVSEHIVVVHNGIIENHERCAPCCSLAAMSSSPRPIPKLLPIWCTGSWNKAVPCVKPSCALSRSCAALTVR